MTFEVNLSTSSKPKIYDGECISTLQQRPVFLGKQLSNERVSSNDLFNSKVYFILYFEFEIMMANDRSIYNLENSIEVPLFFVLCY